MVRWGCLTGQQVSLTSRSRIFSWQELEGRGNLTKNLINSGRNFTFKWKGKHAHYRITQKPWHQVKSDHKEKPRDKKRYHGWDQERRGHWFKYSEDGVG